MDKREEHLRQTVNKEARTEQSREDELYPMPSGRDFARLFHKELDIYGTPLGMPYMGAFSLNEDIILYRAMLIVLSYKLGLIDSKLSIIKDYDSITSKSRAKLIRSLRTDRKRTTNFMSSDAMISLRDNEYASNHHENKARKACYQFIKKSIK